MNLWLALWGIVCLAALALCVRSLTVLRRRSPWTSAGWLLSALYFIIAIVDALRARSAPYHVDYAALVLLTAAFIVAGVHDEPQAEPWWWPNHAGLSGRERRERSP